MKPLSICFITREYAHAKMGGTGGIGVFLKEYTQLLTENGHEVTVYSFGSNPVKFTDKNVNIIKFKDLTKPFEQIKTFFKNHNIRGYITLKMVLEFINRFYRSLIISWILSKKAFDILELHDYGGDTPYFITKIPVVMRCHGAALSMHQFMGYNNRITDSVFEKHAFKRFGRHVIAVSNFSAHITQNTFKLKQKPTVIYNGVQIPEYSNTGLYLDGVLEFSVFYFGSVRERKGIDVACKTFNAIVTRFPKASFHVLGNNNNNYWFEKALPMLSDTAKMATTYYGTVPHNQTKELLKKAHVVIYPSYGENFSIALLEVMALAKLVVVSNIPSFNEVIIHQQNGYIAKDSKDFEKWIQTIFYQGNTLQSIAEQARATVVNNYSNVKVLKDNLYYYQQLLLRQK